MYLLSDNGAAYRHREVEAEGLPKDRVQDDARCFSYIYICLHGY